MTSNGPRRPAYLTDEQPRYSAMYARLRWMRRLRWLLTVLGLAAGLAVGAAQARDLVGGGAATPVGGAMTLALATVLGVLIPWLVMTRVIRTQRDRLY